MVLFGRFSLCVLQAERLESRFRSYFCPILPLFQHRGIAQGVVLDDSGAFWEYGENTISKMNAHKCEQSVRPVDDVSGRVIGYKKRINIITDLDSQTLKI